MKKAEFYWAVVGDANPEPVAVTRENGKRVAYTIGCEDPFYLDARDAQLELIPINLIDDEARPIPIPPKPSEREARRLAREEWLTQQRRRGISHGWRRWNP